MLERTSDVLPPIWTTFSEYWLVDQFGVSAKTTVKLAGSKPVMEFVPATVRSGNCCSGVTAVPSPRSKSPRCHCDAGQVHRAVGDDDLVLREAPASHK